jgi:bifunctional non-homologous end joining protein LigD
VTPAEKLIPPDAENVAVRAGRRTVQLTNLRKPFWTKPTVTKGDLLRYYASVSPWLLPHLRGRAMVMKRYPNGANGPFFFMKNVPDSHPAWLTICPIKHSGSNVVNFPVVDDLASLLWTVNLGCIDLNQWYARCEDEHRPEYLHFDLDPVTGATFARVQEAALLLRDALKAQGMPSFAKTTGSRGIHVYVPIKRGPLQEEVWQYSKAFAMHVAEMHPKLITAVYAKSKRPKGHVFVDYNQNAWGRTLASIYSVRPKKRPTVSAPVTWKELERGVRIEDFRMDNMLQRLRKVGDLWKPLLARTGRVDLKKHMS